MTNFLKMSCTFLCFYSSLHSITPQLSLQIERLKLNEGKINKIPKAHNYSMVLFFGHSFYNQSTLFYNSKNAKFKSL